MPSGTIMSYSGVYPTPQLIPPIPVPRRYETFNLVLKIIEVLVLLGILICLALITSSTYNAETYINNGPY